MHKQFIEEAKNHELYFFMVMEYNPEYFQLNYIPYDVKKNNSFIVLNRRFDNYDRYMEIVKDDVELFKKMFDEFM